MFDLENKENGQSAFVMLFANQMRIFYFQRMSMKESRGKKQWQ
jgi:hypothetical protein